MEGKALKKLSLILIMLITTATILGACGKKEDSDKTTEQNGSTKTEFKVAMVTDVGGVDDKSFNQSAWEGLKEFGKENKLTEKEGFDYAQSASDADYLPNLTRLSKADFDLVYGIGFLMKEAVTNAANENPKTNFAIVDEEITGKKNVASIKFAEHEGSYLVGVVAAMQTKTKKVGFVGGVDMPLIQKFEEGFKAGVKAVDPAIEVVVKYTGAFDKPELGKTTAAAMYKSDIDIIYHASGGTGNGVFSEAKSIKEADPSRDIWVIGVDKDQAPEGLLKDGKTNITLTSMIKRVDIAVNDVATKAMDGKFPGGEVISYDLKSNGVGIAPTKDNLSDEILKKVDEYAGKIKSGEIKVPFERK